MSQALTLGASTAVQSLADIERLGSLFIKSGLFQDVKSEAQAIIKILAGQELGLSPFAAMSELHIIKGKVSMSAGLLAKKVKGSSRYDFKVKELTEKVCSIEFFQRIAGGLDSLGVSTFTIEDAKKAEVQNLSKFGRNMLYARAMSNGVKWFCPDATDNLSVYTDGEIEPGEQPHRIQPAATDIDAEVVEASEPDEEPEAEFVPDYTDPETTDAIVTLWATWGKKDASGKIVPIMQTLRSKGVKDISQIPLEKGMELLKWLQTRAHAAEQEQVAA